MRDELALGLACALAAGISPVRAEVAACSSDLAHTDFREIHAFAGEAGTVLDVFASDAAEALEALGGEDLLGEGRAFMAKYRDRTDFSSATAKALERRLAAAIENPALSILDRSTAAILCAGVNGRLAASVAVWNKGPYGRKAYAALRRAVALAPKNPEACETFGRTVLAFAGKGGVAQSSIESSLDIDIRAEARIAIAQLEAAGLAKSTVLRDLRAYLAKR